MPVLATYHCDIPEVVLDGKTGFLVAERDTDALTEKLKELVSHPHIWAKVSREGRRHIEKNYDVKKQGKELERIYGEIVK
jgi:colanic acid/amylovoran biosynthesis glycosyltransferase